MRPWIDVLENPDDAEAEKDLRSRMVPEPRRIGQPPSPAMESMSDMVLGQDSSVRRALRAGTMRTRENLNEPDPGNISLLSSIALGFLVGGATRNASLGTRVGAQALAAGGAGAFGRQIAGQTLEEMTPDVLLESILAGLAEGAAGPVGRVAGVVGAGATKGVGGMVNAARTAMGIQKAPRVGHGPMRAPFSTRLDPRGGEAAIRTAEELGVIIPPGKVLTSSIIDNLEAIGRASPASSGIFEGVDLATEKGLQAALQRTVDDFPLLSRRQVMDLVQGLRTKRMAEVKGAAQALYKEVDREMGGVPVNFAPVRAQVQALVDKDVLLQTSPTIQRILDLPDNVTYEMAQTARSDLFDLSKQFDIGAGAVVGREKKDAIDLASIVTKQIDESVFNASPGLQAKLQHANHLWKEEVRGKLTDKFILKIANGQPDELLNAVIANNNPGEVRMIREIVDRADPTGKSWRAVQGSFLRNVLFDVSEPSVLPGGVANRVRPVNGERLLQKLDEIGRYDDELIKSMFPGGSAKTIDNMRGYANALRFKNLDKAGGGAGVVAFQLMQVGAVAGGLTAIATGDYGGAAVTGAAAVTLGPRAVAKLFTDPRINKWLTIGAASPPGSRSAARAAIHVFGTLLAEDLIEDEQSRQEANAAVNNARTLLGIEGGMPRVTEADQQYTPRVTLSAEEFIRERMRAKGRTP